jgi:hypothetical protein
MGVAKACGSAGWVCGVGGVHPWELALMDCKLHSMALTAMGIEAPRPLRLTI